MLKLVRSIICFLLAIYFSIAIGLWITTDYSQEVRGYEESKEISDVRTNF